ncbi:Uncharacterised protein [Vibrio cholerae]|nr:Uncharacterised protein [Vibrio cholerae]
MREFGFEIGLLLSDAIKRFCELAELLRSHAVRFLVLAITFGFFTFGFWLLGGEGIELAFKLVLLSRNTVNSAHHLVELFLLHGFFVL